MPSIVSKKCASTKPVVALLPQGNGAKRGLVQTTWDCNPSIVRKIVNSLSDSEVRALSPEARQGLLKSLKLGRITNADRSAINKLLNSEIVEVEYQRRMVIKGASDFVNTTKTHLTNLCQIPIGRKLLESLYKSGKHITIVPAIRISEAPPDIFKDAIPKGAPLKWISFSGKEKVIKGTGLGSNTTIKYNPQFTCSHKTAEWKKSPSEITLAHELIHANDSAYGRLDPSETDGVRNYELQAVGLSPYENIEFTENKFRAAWMPPLPLRMQY
ncbi:MAG: M91 family zinc metallopeptidase [Blastocatellia bacterium]